MSEVWLDIPGYAGLYQASSLGRIRSLDREVAGKLNSVRRVKGRILRPQVLGTGRLQVTLQKGGVREHQTVHRLVAKTFIPNPDNLPMVLHWDDDPLNNLPNNLRWGTREDNVADMIRNGGHYMLNRTHCKNGHEYTPENTGKGAKNIRRCLTCNRARWHTYKQANTLK